LNGPLVRRSGGSDDVWFEDVFVPDQRRGERRAAEAHSKGASVQIPRDFMASQPR
jgi:hypothetical protein